MLTLYVPAEDTGHRLDFWLGLRRPEHSRARWQALIKDGHVQVNGTTHKPNYHVAAGDEIRIEEPPPVEVTLQAEARALDVLFEDGDVLVLNKPPDLVVHPAPGHENGTLVNALLHHCKDLAGIGGERRPGIVHRLDADTSGVIVVAKTEQAHRALTGQFKDREVRKIYVALVWGCPRPPSGTIRTLIGRHSTNRKKMSATPPMGRQAVTHYETVETFEEASFLRIRLETGRTHQIRVHLAHIGHPIVGDRLYGRARKTPWTTPVVRQLLHAETIAFRHPRTGLDVECQAPLPEDFRALLQELHAPRA